VPDRIEHVFRREHGRCVATLIRFLGDIDLAEEAVRDAFTIALAPGSTGPCPLRPRGSRWRAPGTSGPGSPGRVSAGEGEIGNAAIDDPICHRRRSAACEESAWVPLPGCSSAAGIGRAGIGRRPHAGEALNAFHNLLSVLQTVEDYMGAGVSELRCRDRAGCCDSSSG
jgi:hypothetical protein